MNYRHKLDLVLTDDESKPRSTTIALLNKLVSDVRRGLDRLQPPKIRQEVFRKAVHLLLRSVSPHNKQWNVWPATESTVKEVLEVIRQDVLLTARIFRVLDVKPTLQKDYLTQIIKYWQGGMKVNYKDPAWRQKGQPKDRILDAQPVPTTSQSDTGREQSK